MAGELQRRENSTRVFGFGGDDNYADVLPSGNRPETDERWKTRIETERMLNFALP